MGGGLIDAARRRDVSDSSPSHHLFFCELLSMILICLTSLLKRSRYVKTPSHIIPERKEGCL